MGAAELMHVVEVQGVGRGAVNTGRRLRRHPGCIVRAHIGPAAIVGGHLAGDGLRPAGAGHGQGVLEGHPHVGKGLMAEGLAGGNQVAQAL